MDDRPSVLAARQQAFRNGMLTGAGLALLAAACILVLLLIVGVLRVA